MDRVLADITPLGLSPAWLVLASAVLCVVYLTVRPKKRDPLASQPFRTSLVQQRALERDMQNVIVELSEMTRQMSAQLETRAAKLEQLMADADAKIAELKRVRESIPATPGLTTIATDTLSTAEPTPATQPSMRLVTESNPHSEDRWAEVYRLGDEGLTLPEIARRLARPNGEVELILALRQKPQPPQDAPAFQAESSNVASAQ